MEGWLKFRPSKEIALGKEFHAVTSRALAVSRERCSEMRCSDLFPEISTMSQDTSLKKVAIHPKYPVSVR